MFTWLLELLKMPETKHIKNIEDIDEVEEFTKPTDSIPEKSISVSIEHLRKKMSDDKEN